MERTKAEAVARDVSRALFRVVDDEVAKLIGTGCDAVVCWGGGLDADTGKFAMRYAVKPVPQGIELVQGPEFVGWTSVTLYRVGRVPGPATEAASVFYELAGPLGRRG